MTSIQVGWMAGAGGHGASFSVRLPRYAPFSCSVYLLWIGLVPGTWVAGSWPRQ